MLPHFNQLFFLKKKRRYMSLTVLIFHLSWYLRALKEKQRKKYHP